ncbi:TonB-dependent receptor plug domain-containing protein [Marinigracilibium pacificum]|uniref:TonB-dependent receptor n=1 Tax=Marinigracilibium pacificum TaxID=2729599 RepID=A0A848J1F4_9BACT|nr:TonB-dependent receptor [Marinigracilibium pacificum]NMM50387.1 TonB-dependent receptor [Marinigracilibium pacificum]
MQKEIVSIIFLLVAALNLNAQHILTLSDGQSPVEGAYVSITSIPDGETATYISGTNGEVIAQYSLPYSIYISHLSFVPFADTIQSEKDLEIRLERSNIQLNDIVVTGEFEPISAKKSVYNVRTLSRDQVLQFGATNISDVLSRQLNFRFNRDNATGSSGVSIQGISGQNVKVLINGIPVSGRQGVNNEIDLGQIDISSVERVEIVEGPMSAVYGSDALAGVVNIITRTFEEKIFLEATLQEESVGNEYSFYSEGIHAPSIRVGYKPGDFITIGSSIRLNKFGGWTGNATGREKEWHPKDQLFLSGSAEFTRNNLSFNYKLDYLDEKITNLGSINDNDPLKDPTAIDEKYIAIRFFHQFSLSWKLFNLKNFTSASYTDYDRVSHQYVTNLNTGDERTTVDSEQDTTSYDVFFLRNVTMDILGSSSFDLQIGTEINLEKAEGTTLSTGAKRINNYALFLLGDIKVGDKLMVRPGLRFSKNNVFDTRPVPSLNLKYTLNDKVDIRFAYGRGFRVPSIRELYHEFIDSNHNIIGNDQLKPEYSNSFNTVLGFHPKKSLNLNFKLFYNDIQDRISLLGTTANNQSTTYVNLERYKTLGSALYSNWEFKELTTEIGIGYTGLYQSLFESDYEVPQFVYSPEVTVNIKYNWKKARTYFTANWKFSGAQERYQLYYPQDSYDPEVRKGGVAGYQMLDLSSTTNIKENVRLSLGVRNALNITALQNTSSQGVHGGGSSSPISYGRSFYINFIYQWSK